MTIPTNPLTLQDAKAYLALVRDTFKDDPELLAVYEPTALYMVQIFEETPSLEELGLHRMMEETEE